MFTNFFVVLVSAMVCGSVLLPTNSFAASITTVPDICIPFLSAGTGAATSTDAGDAQDVNSAQNETQHNAEQNSDAGGAQNKDNTNSAAENPTQNEKQNQTKTVPPIPTTIVINEFLPNPAGADGDGEFIEIKNIGQVPVDISGWKLGDASTKRFEIKNTVLDAQHILVFWRGDTGISLNNTGTEDVKLFDALDRLVDAVQYSESAADDVAYAREGSGVFFWTERVTPGFENVFIIPGDNSVSVDKTNANDTVKNNESKKDTSQNNANNTAATSTNAVAPEGQSALDQNASVQSGQTEQSAPSADSNFFAEMDLSEYIRISEFVPNPFGTDDGEFIELVNPGNTPVLLSGLKLDDEDGGSWPYTIPDGVSLWPGEYLVFWRADTGLALNNTGDRVRVLDSSGTVITESEYGAVVEGAARISDEDGEWFWTDAPTPGAENILVPISGAGSSAQGSAAGGGDNAIGAGGDADTNNVEKELARATISQVRNFDLGDRVHVTGVVGALPGVFSTQYMYIVDQESTSSSAPGVQVYMYKKDFGDLALGDVVDVFGEVAESQGELRIKLSAREDIVVDESGADIVAHSLEIAQIGEAVVSEFIETSGEITELKGSYMYIDDGTAEQKVYFKKGTGIDKGALAVGDIVRVFGFVNKIKSGYQILPRMQEDIEKIGVAQTVLQAAADMEKQNEKDVAEKYLTATAGGLTSIIVGLLAKSRGALALGFIKKVRGLFTFAAKA